MDFSLISMSDGKRPDDVKQKPVRFGAIYGVFFYINGFISLFFFFFFFAYCLSFMDNYSFIVLQFYDVTLLVISDY